MPKRSRKRQRRQLPEGLHIDTGGDRIELGLAASRDEVPTVAQPWCDVGNDDFNGTCPLCVRRYGADAIGRQPTAEHVPPFSVGGFVRTRTCKECNGSGSAAEADLVRWWAKERRGKLSTSGIEGARSAGDVLFRATANGGFALVVGGGAAFGASSVLRAAGRPGEVTATFFSLTGGWEVALLKAAYLAACIHLGEIPTTPDAEHARAVIKSGSFGARGPYLGVGADAVPMHVFRAYDGDPARVWVGHAVLPWSGGGVPIFGVGLGRLAFVTWPVPDVRRHALRLALARAA